MVRWGAPNCKPMQLCIEDKIWKSYWKPSHNNINKSWTKTSNIIRSCNKNNFHHLHCGAHTQPQTATTKTNTTTNNLWKAVRNKPQTTPLALPSTFIQKHTSQRTAKADQKPYNIIQQEIAPQNCSHKTSYGRNDKYSQHSQAPPPKHIFIYMKSLITTHVLLFPHLNPTKRLQNQSKNNSNSWDVIHLRPNNQ